MGNVPVKIDYRKCNGCQRCYDLCPMDIFVIDESLKMPKAAYQEECGLCGICWMECPKRAIDIIYPPSMW